MPPEISARTIRFDRSLLNRACFHPAGIYPGVKKNLQRIPIEELPQHKAIVLNAPTGYGKTSVLGSWYESMLQSAFDGTVSWLSINQTNSDDAFCLAHVLYALDGLWPGLWDVVAEHPENSTPNRFLLILSSATARLENEMGAESRVRPKVLLVDDIDLLSAAMIKACFLLLDVLPDSFRLICSGSAFTKELRAGLLDSRFIELRENHLTLTEEEIQSRVSHVMADTEPDQNAINRLCFLTGGFPKGVNLAIERLKINGDITMLQDFDASDEMVDLYFESYAERFLSQEMLEQCMAFSFVESFCPSLCEAIVPGINGVAVIEDLRERSAFILSLDDRDCWFKFLPLFSDWLRRRLLRKKRSLLEKIGWSAADWYEARGDFLNMTRALIMAHDIDTLVELIQPESKASSLEGYSSEAHREFLRLAELPVKSLGADPVFCILGAWTHIFFCRSRDARECISRLKVASREDSAVAPSFSNASVMCAEARCRFLEGDVEGALECVNDLLETGEHEANSHIATAVFHTMAQVNRHLGNYDAALNYYHRAKACIGENVDLPLLLHSDYEIGLLHFERGDFDQAEKICTEALSRWRSTTDTCFYGAFHSLLSRVQSEHGDFSSSSESIRSAKAAASLNLHPDFYYETMLSEATGFYDQGDNEKAYELATKLIDCVKDKTLPRDVLTQAYLLLIDIVWVLGNGADSIRLPIDVRARLKTNANGPMYLPLIEALEAMAARMFDDALVRIKHAQSLALAGGLRPLFLREKILEANLYKCVRNPQKASAALGDALSEAARIDSIAPLLVELRCGRMSVKDVERVKPSSPGTRHFIGRVLSLAVNEGISIEDAPSNAVGKRLTARENEVLDLLRSGLNRGEIADELSISRNTVKAHVSSIYAKLGVTNHSELLTLLDSPQPSGAPHKS